MVYSLHGILAEIPEMKGVNLLKPNSSNFYALPYRFNLPFLPERDYVTFGSLLS